MTEIGQGAYAIRLARPDELLVVSRLPIWLSQNPTI